MTPETPATPSVFILGDGTTIEKVPFVIMYDGPNDATGFAVPIADRVTCDLHKRFSAIVRDIKSGQYKTLRENPVLRDMNAAGDDKEARNKVVRENFAELLDVAETMEEAHGEKGREDVVRLFREIVDTRHLTPEQSTIATAPVVAASWGDQDLESMSKAVIYFRQRLSL